MNTLRDKDFSLPSEIKIGCHVYEIRQVSVELSNARNVHGRCLPNINVIEISAGLNRGQALEVLLHELLHAICYVYVIKDEDKEERIVSILGTALACLFQDNPSLTTLYIPQLACPPASQTPSQP